MLWQGKWVTVSVSITWPTPAAAVTWWSDECGIEGWCVLGLKQLSDLVTLVEENRVDLREDLSLVDLVDQVLKDSE